MSRSKPTQGVSGNDTPKGIDSLTKQYIKSKNVFASAFNYFLYGGKEIIRPEQLHTVDTTEVVVPYGEDDTGIKSQPVQKIRDAFFSVMTDGNRIYMLCGLENQTIPHNAMPVRNGLYDFMEYAAQVQEAADSHRKSKNYGEDSVDFLSGFYKTDRLIPVYTLVIFWGPGEWTAPRSLFEMLDVKDKSDYYGLNDWKINLIIPDEITEEDAIEKFGSELGKALIYIKNMGNPEDIERIYKDARFRLLEPETALMLNEILNADLKIERKDVKVDMCVGLEKLQERATILSAIDTAKRYGIADEAILADIMKQFNLTEEEAKEYISKENCR